MNRIELTPSSLGCRRLAGPLIALLMAQGLVVVAGCSRSEPPRFHLNMQDFFQNLPSHDPDEFRVTGAEGEDPKEKQDKAKQLALVPSILEAAFGTPDEPYLLQEIRRSPDNETGLDLRAITLAAGPSSPTLSDATDKHRGLYRQNCAHCHGISGDGAGPTAAYLNPYPRDYRRGVFKFKSTETASKPTIADLRRTLVDGIPGTAMPSFALLPPDEIDALVEYVRYLSVRGQTEINLGIAIINDEEIEPSRQSILDDYLTPVMDEWAAADGAVINPSTPPSIETPAQLRDSIKKGRILFAGQKSQCAKCHGPTGLGDGWASTEPNAYDDWNKDKTPDNEHLWLLPKQRLKPRNLRLGIYRGGRRPLDLFRRVYAGIPAAQMPAAGKSPGKSDYLSDDEIWHLVNYVRSLPYAPSVASPHTASMAPRERL